MARVDVTDQTFQTEVIERSEREPVVVDFWADWCGPCKMLGPVLEEQTTEQGVTLAKIDVDANQEVARQYGISGIPAVKAFRNGQVVAEFVGAVPPARVKEFLDDLTKPSLGGHDRRSGNRRGPQGEGLRARAADAARARRDGQDARGAERGAHADGADLPGARAGAPAREHLPQAARRRDLLMRLNAWLARAGVASRRKADELIKDGRVTVNGEPGQLNTFVERTDDVRLDGKPLAKQELSYVLLHKPAGVVTTASDPQGRTTVVDLVELPTRVVPVGRLDADTTGALLLTNDGDLAHQLAHPKYEIDKVYVVQLWKQPSDGTLRKLAEGVNLDDGKTAPAEVRRLAGSTIELTIHEGRNRQVKRMFEAVGYRVKALHRARYALDTPRARARPVARARALGSGSVTCD